MLNSFGATNANANTWPEAFLQSFQIVTQKKNNIIFINFSFDKLVGGQANYDDMQKADPTLAPLFFFVFYIVFNLIVFLVFMVKWSFRRFA